MSASSSIKPIHGHAFFTLDYAGGFAQLLIFDYYDPEKFYYGLLRDEDEYDSAMDGLLASMNELLRTEEIWVNSVRVYPEALTVNLDFRGEAEKPTISFYIEFKGKLNPGAENVYECRYEPGPAEYDYEVYWFFPAGSRIVEVVTDTDYEVYGERFLVFWARKGDQYGGYEKIEFTLPGRRGREAP